MPMCFKENLEHQSHIEEVCFVRCLIMLPLCCDTVSCIIQTVVVMEDFIALILSNGQLLYRSAQTGPPNDRKSRLI